jgi:hypothetical protein
MMTIMVFHPSKYNNISFAISFVIETYIVPFSVLLRVYRICFNQVLTKFVKGSIVEYNVVVFSEMALID